VIDWSIPFQEDGQGKMNLSQAEFGPESGNTELRLGKILESISGAIATELTHWELRQVPDNESGFYLQQLLRSR
jgi:hypothetical protein